MDRTLPGNGIHRYACILAICLISLWLTAAPAPATAAEAQLTPAASPPTPKHLDQALARLADWWFPRVVDEERGGFHQRFDAPHRPITDSDNAIRTTVFQSRITWVAATLAETLPDRADQLRPYVDHGLNYLRGHLCDPEHGGIYWSRTVAGQPTDRWGEQKHAYATAFALYAGAAAARVFPDSSGQALARELFVWLEEHAHDDAHGGYIEAFDGNNNPLLAPLTIQGEERKFDPIGTLYGYKSMNSHIHLLEAFIELHRVWPNPLLRQRLAELDQIIRQRMFVEPGCLHLFYTRDWRPLPGHSSFGHDVETAFLLVESGRTLKMPDEQVLRQPRQLIDHALAYGWDSEFAGLFDAGSAFQDPTPGSKIGWVQAEMLNALATAHALWPHEPLYATRLAEQWGFITSYLIDPADGGWYSSVSRNGVEVTNPLKIHDWNAGYHAVRSLVYAQRALREREDNPQTH